METHVKHIVSSFKDNKACGIFNSFNFKLIIKKTRELHIQKEPKKETKIGGIVTPSRKKCGYKRRRKLNPFLPMQKKFMIINI